MRVLSLFDGISCARVALERAEFTVSKYYASEVDKTAKLIASKNYPDTIQLGDVRRIKGDGLGNIDLLIGGSPCQDLSIASHNRKGLDGERSGLFWEYVRILNEAKPKWFILENVASMSRKDKETITEALGVAPIMINAALVSAQSRKRLFWTNIPNIGQPEDRGILLKDVLLPETYTEFDKCYPLTASYNGAVLWNSIEKCQRTMVWNKPIRVGHLNKGGQSQRVYSIEGKSVCLNTAAFKGQGAATGLYLIKDYARKLEPIECERLQGLPDNYTEGVSKNNRRKCLGNAFNVDVVVHILKNIPNQLSGISGQLKQV